MTDIEQSETEIQKVTKGKKPDFSTFNQSIQKVCKGGDNNASISSPCLGILDKAVKVLITSISSEAKTLAISQKTNHKKLNGAGAKTITIQTIKSALDLLFDLQKYDKSREALTFAETTSKNYLSNKDSKTSNKRTSRDDLAGSNVSIPKVESVMREKNSMRITQDSPVLLSAYIEFIITFWITEANEIASQHSKKTVTPKFLGMAVERNAELKNFLSCGGRNTVCVVGGGTIFPKKKKTSQEVDDITVEQ